MPYGYSLSTLVSKSETPCRMEKARLHTGDWMIVHTRNSVYTIRTVGGGVFEITGGWFDLKGASPVRTRINGCTWGGKTINVAIAAACGLCIEFSNHVVTSPVQKIYILRNAVMN